MMFPLIGNEKIRLSVENFILSKRIPHAILIEGDHGTGRHTLTNFLANAAVCAQENAPCGSCRNCSLVKSLSHPDIVTIAPLDGKKSIAVKQIRQAREEAYIKPHEAEKRVFIIDCADTMNAESQNALLKVLEEPPKTVMFILIAESKAALLDTIISRCVVLSLTSPEFSKGFEYIKKNTQKEDFVIEQALNSSQNNIGKALEILDGNLGTDTEIAANEFLEALLNNDSLSMLSAVARFEKNWVATDKFIKDLKYLIAQKIKNDPQSYFAKPLVAFYNCLPEYEQSLATNINLNLLFCSMTCKAGKLFGGKNDRSYIG